MRSTVARRRAGSARAAAESGVSTWPGWTELALTPLPAAAHSSAVDLVNRQTPPFDAQYAPVLGPATSPRIEEMLMIDPLPERASNGSEYFVPRKTLSRLTAMVARQSARVVSAIDWNRP